MYPQRFVLLFVFFIGNSEVEARFSTSTLAKAQRSQSMRPIIPKTTSVLNVRALSGSISDTSLTEIEPGDPQPIPSTSFQRRLSVNSLKEVELEPLVAQAKHVKFSNPVNLNEASVQTQSVGGQINPIQHGVFARVRNAFLQFGGSCCSWNDIWYRWSYGHAAFNGK